MFLQIFLHAFLIVGVLITIWVFTMIFYLGMGILGVRNPFTRFIDRLLGIRESDEEPGNQVAPTKRRLPPAGDKEGAE
jgi:hypothetical protein